MGNPNPELHPENLRPIKPGEVRNPNGSSRKQRLTTALLKAIESKGLDDPFVQVGLREALKGDFRFWQYIFDRIDGKMIDKVQSEETQVVVDRRDRAKRNPRGTAPDPATGEGPGEPV